MRSPWHRGLLSPRVFTLASLSLTALLALPASTVAAGRDGLQQIGTPTLGSVGFERTTADIMAQARAEANIIQEPMLMPEPEGPDRGDLPQNPASPHVSSIPAFSEKLNGTSSLPGRVFTPQALGVNFTAATLAGTNSTGSFPPDCDGAVGPTQYIVAVNGRIVTFNKTTGVADAVLNATTNTFFTSVRSGSGTSDPMCRYDRLSARWFISIINVSTPNRWLLAVSDAASNGTISGTTVWTYYFFIPATTSPTISNGSTCLSDYPSLGVDNNALYMGVSEFCGTGQPFQQTDVFVIRKTSVLSGGPIVVTAFRALMTATGGYVGPFSARGCDNYDPAANEGYFIGVDGASTGTFWLNRISNPGGTPGISSNISITLPAYYVPRPVPHPSNSGGYWGRLDPLDDRPLTAHIRNQQLWCGHSVGIDNTGSSDGTYLNATRVGARWYQINVPVNAGAPTIVQAGTVFTTSVPNDSAQKNYFIPSVMVSGQGHAAVGFTTAGETDNANAGTVGRLATDPLGTMETPVAITTNTNTYNPASDPGGISAGRPRRWGDYSITAVDPLDDMSMWTVQEFVNANNSYGVRVAKLIAPPPATPGAMADVQAGQGSVSVTLTGLSASGSGFFDPGTDLPLPARAFTHLSASISAGAATGTPPSVVSIAYVDPTTATVVLNTSAATANLASEKYTITVTNPDGQTASGAVVHVVAANSVTITASADTGGTITPSGAVAVTVGASQSFTITANSGYHVQDVLVNGVSVGAVTTYTFTAVAANQTIAASFALDQYTLTVTAVGAGSVLRSPNQATYAYGTTITLTAMPAAGSAFTLWSGDTTTAGNPLAIVITGNRAFTASFADTAAPVVSVTAPNGGQSLGVGTHTNLTWTAMDNTGVTSVDLFLSRAGAAGPYDSIATNQANSGSYDYLVTGPMTTDAFLKVVARDAAGNTAQDQSDAAFSIIGTTGVDDGPVTAFALSGVVPNPTHGLAHVTFALPRAARIRVAVLDVQGREVLTLAAGEYGAGRHSVALAAGRKLSAGLYFVRMSTPEQTFVKRFAIMK